MIGQKIIEYSPKTICREKFWNYQKIIYWQVLMYVCNI